MRSRDKLRLFAPLALTLLLLAPAAAGTRSLTILHTNDLHARLMPLENGRGGFARLATAIRRERAGCNDCVLLNAGDLAQGSPVSTIFHGLPVWEIANLFGYDAGTLGNHDFDYGWEQARGFIDAAKYPVVVSNLVDQEGRLFAQKPYLILSVNHVRVAVIGAMTDEFMTSLTTPKIRGPWRTLPVLETARKYAAEARAKADLVVLLGHVSEAEELALLHQAPEIPVIVTGHAHKGMDAPLADGGRVLVRTKAYAEELGRLELQVDTETKSLVKWNWKRIAIGPEFSPAPDVAAQVEHWEGEVTKKVDQPLAMSSREFSKTEVKALIERIMCERTGADFAFVNAGGVRDALPKGQIKVRHVWNIMPFDNVVLTGKFKGSQLPAVATAGRTVDPEREYRLAVTDFTAANQSAASQLQSHGLTFPEEHGLLRDMIVDWLAKKQTLE